MSRILCVGDAMVDVQALLPGELAVGSDTPAPVSFSHGGSAANTAAWLAHFGEAAAFAGRVGDDSFGRDVVARLASSGVVPFVATDPELATGVCLVLVAPGGERTMIPSVGANAGLRVADLPTLTGSDHLHLSGYSLFNDGSRPAARAALAQAVAVGAGVSVDVASAAPIRALGADRLLSWLPREALLFANADELTALTGASNPEPLTVLGFTVIVKDGARGATIGRPGHEPVVVATVAVEVVDSTGAGDAFAAGVLAALRSGADLETAAARGNQAGAQAVLKLGARP